MAEYGMTQSGFRIRTYADLDEFLREEATKAFRSVLGKNTSWTLTWDNSSPICVFYRVLESELYRLWLTAEKLYWSTNVLTATGDALDLLVTEHGIFRRPGSKARGIVSLRGLGFGGVLARGTELVAENGERFVLAEDVPLEGISWRDAWIEAVEPGTRGNIGPGTSLSLVNVPGAVEVLTDRHEARFGVSAPANIAWTVPNSGSWNYYQVLNAADIAHPYNIEEVRFVVRNPNQSFARQTFRLEVALVDDTSGKLLGRSGEIEIVLDRNEEREVRWSGLRWNVGYGYKRLRLHLLNSKASTSEIEVLGNTTNPYPGCYWHQGGGEYAGAAALFTVVSVRPGGTWGGEDPESDAELRLRFLNTKARGGASHLEAVKAAVWAVPGVRAVKVKHNREDVPVDDLPPHSVKVIVEGGAEVDVAYALLRSVPAGIRWVGDLTVEVEDMYGERHTVRFSRPVVREIYAKVRVKRGIGFTQDTVREIQDAVVRVVGGYTSDGSFYTLGVGEDVSHAKVAKAVLSVRGVEDVLSVELGTSPNDLRPENVEIGDEELARTRPENVTVLWE